MRVYLWCFVAGIDHCVGNPFGYTKFGHSDDLGMLRKQYSGCPIVFGNVVIAHFKKAIGNRTAEEMEHELEFFNTIEQITGSLMIFETELESITFKNLKIIWGDELHDGVAVLIEGNKNLRHLNLPSLRSVERGSVALFSNPYLCHLEKTILFSEIVGKDIDRVSRKNTSKMCYTEPKPVCHPKCGNYCWGPEEDNCQIIYRTNCPEDCNSGMCHFDGANEPICCDDACAAGCTGRGSDDCVACRRLNQDGQCVDRCNGLTSYDIVRMMTVPHEKPRYTHNRFCVEQCPPTTIIENENCVHQCSKGYFYDVNNKPFKCEPCKDGICPKVCDLKETLNGANIEGLRGCTTIEGFINIPVHVFEPHTYRNLDYSLPSKEDIDDYSETNITIPALTEKQLEILSTVRTVTQYVEISGFQHSPHNFSFLRNLETIVGRGNTVYTLKIFKNVNLKFLGLKSLKHIIGGRVLIMDNQALCFADTLNLTWDKIIHQTPEYGQPKFRIENNRKPEWCQRQNRVCSTACDTAFGCWGPGTEQCVSCKYFYDGQKCLYKCPAEGNYVDGKNCSRCADECVNCTGPSDEDCSQCKHVSLQQGNKKQCLPKCPNSHYNNNGTCLSCHSSCYDFGCTGGSDYVGPGGCNRCQYGVEVNGTIKCLFTKNATSVCKENNFTNYFIFPESTDLIRTYRCKKCADDCLSCAGFGTDTFYHQCECAHYLTEGWQRSYCTAECKTGSFLVEQKTANKTGRCHLCHDLCDPSYNCIGKNYTDCERCKIAGIREDDEQICLHECPAGSQLFEDVNNICHHTDPAAVLKRKRQITVFGGVLAAVLFIVIASLLGYNCYKYKSRYKEQIELNPPMLPECEPIDASVKPNMSQLRLISIENLYQTSKPLGSGAFGIVYAGYWYPEGKGKGKRRVAIKVVQDSTGEAQKDMLAEAGIMASMRHRHLLPLIGVCLSNGIQLVTPLCKYGSLRGFLIRHRKMLGARDLLIYCFQIASAMEYLFKNRLVHRDLAARNVLVKDYNHVKVTDFGLARMLEKGKKEVIVDGKVALKWLAIECLSNRIYNHATDVWAFGVTCWEILTFGQTPYPNFKKSCLIENMLPYLLAGNRLEQPNNCSEDVYQVLLQCWLENPDSRPTFVILKNYFESFSRAYHRYVVVENEQSATSLIKDRSNHSDILEEGLTDDDFADSLNDFDQNNEQITETTTLPMTPTRGWSTDSCSPPAPNGFSLDRFHNGKGKTSSSTRYQSDPVHGNASERNINTDDTNYLMPNSASMYTPVLVYENGESELLNTPIYYNDIITTESKMPMIPSLENREYFANTETTL